MVVEEVEGDGEVDKIVIYYEWMEAKNSFSFSLSYGFMIPILPCISLVK